MALNFAWAKNLARNPLLEKDLRSTARSLRFFLSVIAFVFIACIIVLIAAADMNLDRPGTSRALFTIIFYTQVISIALAIPAYSCTSIAGERQHRTFDLLRLTSLQPWEIMWGKFIAIQVFILVFAIAFLPLIAICFLYGGIDPEWVLTLYLYMLLSTSACSAFCLMLSASSDNPIKTTIVGYIWMFAFAFPWTVLAVEVYDLEDSWGAVRAEGLFSEASLYIAMGLTMMFSLFYLGGSSLLKPASWNKSTALRLWFLGLITSVLIVYAIAAPNNLSADDFAPFLVFSIGLPAVIAAIGFCGEQMTLPARLRTRLQKIPRLLRIFGPGQRSAALFVRLVFGGGAIISFIIFLAKALSGDQSLNVWMLLGCFVFVNFCCTLSAAARKMWDTPRSRIISIVSLAALVLLPMLGMLDFNRHHPLAGMVWISPPLAVADAIENELGGLETGPLFFFGFYAAATILLFVAGEKARQKRLAQENRLHSPVIPVEAEALQQS